MWHPDAPWRKSFRTLSKPIKVLLQTTIVPQDNDWTAIRFSRLREYLSSLKAADGSAQFEVTARDRGPVDAPDPVLSRLDRSDYDELWLFAVDEGDGLHEGDTAGILRFRERGGGLLIARDHMDLGCSVCPLGPVGAANLFHTRNIDGPVPDPDDRETPHILWPNFHSGRNGDYQRVQAELPLHPVMRDPDSEAGALSYLPAHPHEGAVFAPESDPNARVVATGRSLATGNRFNIAVAFESSGREGRAIAESTFHHFNDYNWDTRHGCPTFVSEPPGTSLASTPRAMASVHRYVRNVALWLAGKL